MWNEAKKDGDTPGRKQQEKGLQTSVWRAHIFITAIDKVNISNWRIQFQALIWHTHTYTLEFSSTFGNRKAHSDRMIA